MIELAVHIVHHRSWLGEFQHWLAVHTGTINESGPYYGFWSGFGSDIGEVTLVGAVLATMRNHNCHSKRCWRLAKHEVAGGQYKICSHHHRQLLGQDEAPTFETIAIVHGEHVAVAPKSGASD